jgi:hypothetical protein
MRHQAMAYQPSQKTRKTVLGIGGIAVPAGLNAPATFDFASEKHHEYKIAQPGHQAKYGSRSQVDIPQKYRANAIHASLLHTGTWSTSIRHRGARARSLRTERRDRADHDVTGR